MRDLVSTLILLGVLQGAVLAVVLWARRANRLGNRILGALVGAVALMLLLGDLERRWAFSGHPHLLGLGAPLPFLFGPLLYLYVIALTRPLVRFDPRWLVHALPFVADVLYLAQTFYLEGGGEKLARARAATAGLAPASFHLVGVLGVVQALVYLLLGWRALARYGRKMHGYFSDLAGIDLRWLKALVLVHVGVWTVVLVNIALRLTGHASGALALVVQIGASFAIFLTGYVSLWQPELVQKASAATVAEQDADEDVREVAQEVARQVARQEARQDAQPASPLGPVEPPPPEPPLAGPPAPAPPPPPKYQRNRLDDDEAEELVRRLEALMAERELYKDSGLTLPTLAEALGITPHMLSQVLNVRVGKSFFVFVNVYRAEALKRALAAPSRADRGVLELALEVGFSSKSTLNSFFKKHTGMTPTEFRSRAQTKNA